MKQLLLLCLLVTGQYLFAQQPPPPGCAQKQVNDRLFNSDPSLRALHEQLEARLYQYHRDKKTATGTTQKTEAVVHLPVVVHIIHNNGSENISNAQVQTAIQHLNEAFANTGYYDPADGVNTEIQFCLAKRDPSGNATTGINRVVSPLTNMGGISNDLSIKNLIRWDPRCYINIWIVKSIGGSIAGYATLPYSHGGNSDGIVVAAPYFGSSYSNDVVISHEMGHYLGLYHTFEQGCVNNDCASQGDRVCDTPPDQATVYLPCNQTANSCSTDALSGFSSDQNDQMTNYMDYANWDCMKVFTAGQSARMNWFVQNVRSSLLNCRSCSEPCPAPVTANFTASAHDVPTGTNVSFTNTSSNASAYRWYVNGVLQSTAFNYSNTFNTAGTYFIRMVALSSNPLCDSAVKRDTIRVNCPVNAAFSPLNTTTNVSVTLNFTNGSTSATTYAWYVDDVLRGTGLNFSYAFTGAGNYVIKMRASNGVCSDSIAGTVVVNDTCIRQTFQKVYGGPGDDVAYDVRSTTDGGYIMAGRTNSFGSGGYDGYIVKMDNEGVVQWSRTYGGTADEVIHTIRQTADGGYVMAGQTKSYGNPLGDAWVTKIDGAGTIQWSKRFGENSVNGDAGYGICQTSDGGYAIAGAQNTSPGVVNAMVFKLDASGNVSWSKIFDSGLTDEARHVEEDNGALMVTGYTRQSASYHDVFLMRLDLSNGNAQWIKRYEVDGRNNFAGELFKVGNAYKLYIPTIQDFSNLNTGRNIVLTLDNNGNATSVQQIITPDNGVGAVTIGADGGIVAAYNEQNSVSDFNFMKLSSTGNVQWAKKYSRPGPQSNHGLRPSQDGGYITLGGSNNDIYVAKTDVQGNTAGCDTVAIAVSITNPPYTSGDFAWGLTRNGNFTAPFNITVSSSAATTQTTGLCSGTTCVDPSPGDTCSNFTFQKLIGGSSGDVAYDVKPSFDGGYMVAGKKHAGNNPSDALIMKMDAKGNLVWSKTYGTSGQDGFIFIHPTKDSNFVAVGYGRLNASHVTDMLIVKIDRSGNLIWSKAYGAGTTFGEQGIMVAETDDGGYAVSVNYNTNPSTVQPMYMKLDANGNMQWSRLLAGSPGGEGLSVAVKGNSMYGLGVVTRSTTTFSDGYILKMNVNDGSLLWTRRIESQGRNNRLDQMRMKNDELICSMFNSDSWTTVNILPMVVKADTNGNILSARTYQIQGISANALHVNVHPDLDGGFITHVSELGNNTSPRMAKIAAGGAVSWVRNYAQQFSQTFYRALADSSGYIAVGRAIKQSGGQQQILVIKTNPAGTLTGSSLQSCPVTTSPATNNNIPVQSIPEPAAYWNISNGNMQLAAGNLTVTPLVLPVETPCADTTLCVNPPPPDTCNSFTFQRLIGGSSGDVAYDAKRSFDGGYMVAGKRHIGSNPGDALIMKLDEKGTLEWSKTYGTSGEDAFYYILPTKDNNFVAVGFGKLNAARTSDVLVVKIDPGGNLIWSRGFGASTPSGEQGIMISETDDGGYAVSLNYNTNPSTVQPAFIKLDASGNLVWSRLLSGNPGGEGLCVAVQGNVMYGSGVIARSNTTFNDGYIVKMRTSDGAMIWTRRIESQSRSNRLDHMKLKGNELTFSMYNADSWTTGNILPLIIKTDTSGNITYSKSYAIQGLNTSTLYPSIQLARDGFIASISEHTNNTSPRLVKISNNGTVNWVKNYRPYFQQTFHRNLDDSTGYVGVGKVIKQSGGQSQILIIKTTPDGSLTGNNLANCPVTTSTATNTDIAVQSISEPASYWSISNGNIQQQVANITVTPIILPVETPCADSILCDPPPPPDTCSGYSFVKQYHNADSTADFYDADLLPDNHVLVSSVIYRSGKSTFGLSKMNQRGAVLWSREYDYLEGSAYVKSIVMADSNVLSLVNTTNTDTSGFILVKTNYNGAIIWYKKYKPALGVYATGLAQTADGNIFVIGYQRRTSFDDRLLLFKMDMAGNMIWVKKHRIASSLVISTAFTILPQHNSLYVFGDAYAERNGAFLWKVSGETGAHQWMKHYSLPGVTTISRNIARHGSGFIILTHSQGASASKEAEVIRVDSNGNVLNSKQIRFLSVPNVLHALPAADSGVIVYANMVMPWGTDKRNTFIHLDTALNFVRSYKYAQAGFPENIAGMLQLSGNTFLGYGHNFYPGAKRVNYAGKFIDDGLLPGCTADTIIPEMVQPQPEVRNFATTVVDEPYQVYPLIVNRIDNILTVNTAGCEAVLDCNTLELNGSDTACSLDNVFEFRAVRNANCVAGVYWNIDTAFAQVISSTDSLVRIRFRQTGMVTLRAKVNTACSLLQDSLVITVLDGKDSLDLGPDVLLCKISTLTLNAGGGFKTYRWQDGATDSTYTVHLPGTYYVEAEDHCGNIFRDTVEVAQAPDVPFDLGPDVAKCNTDTVTLTAPAGFVKYNWSANYNISSRYTQSVQVWPSVDTSYTVIAETANGCLVFDTIRVTIKAGPRVDLGNDTSFCRNDSLVMTAPAGFTSYTWSTGETTPQITVKNKGIYRLVAVAANGCISRDTLEVFNVYSLPLVNLGRDTILCESNTYTFSAGSFSAYQWQDGSAGSTFTTGQVGKYWVSVMDANGCRGSDTASILRIAAPPQDFLDTAIAFCSYEKATLTPIGNYPKYRWSTGATSRSIEVNLPGQYWLEVTNADGCTNREFINVKHKNCLNSIHFPNAFTPDNNRLHDSYKPVVRGILARYKITIYNRWGQRVFETMDYTRGWDGTIAGKPQDSGTFVWVCEYQFPGEEIKTAKGTLQLIR
jgi:gliding motility-associated-like protein